jgi:hypothetical protein
MAKGSCLCGAIQYEVDGNIDVMANCHCSMCRKHHGASFVAYAGVKPSQFRWLQGEELLVDYESSPGTHRAFCRTCGSSLPAPHAGEAMWFFPVGTLDDDPGQRVQGHIFVGSRAPWVEITDDLPQFEEYPPGFGPDAVD